MQRVDVIQTRGVNISPANCCVSWIAYITPYPMYTW